MTTSCDENDEDPSEQKVEEITIKFFYKPRTLTALALCVLSMFYFAFVRDADHNQHDNFWHGCLGAIALFLVICLLICPNGPFIRPHPAIWRLVFGISVVYAMFLAFLLFQSYKDVLTILQYFDPKLKSAKPDTEVYAEDCSWSVFLTRLDIFCVAHFLGFTVKAIMLRNASVLWLMSITWEFTEIAFSHLLANFKECWWDSLILDVLLCNGLGIHFGLYICKKLEMRTYYWESIKDLHGATKKFRRAVMQFTPVSWTSVQWFDPKDVRMRFFALCTLVIAWQVAELNTFFLKHIFIIPTHHWLNVARIVLVSLVTMPTIRQYYLYVTDTRCKRLGTQTWVFVCITCLEATLCVRHARELFSMTEYKVIFAWIVFQTFLCFLLLYFLIIWRGKRSLNASELKASSTLKKTTSPQNLRFEDDDADSESDGGNNDRSSYSRMALRSQRKKKYQ